MLDVFFSSHSVVCLALLMHSLQFPSHWLAFSFHIYSAVEFSCFSVRIERAFRCIPVSRPGECIVGNTQNVFKARNRPDFFLLILFCDCDNFSFLDLVCQIALMRFQWVLFPQNAVAYQFHAWLMHYRLECTKTTELKKKNQKQIILTTCHCVPTELVVHSFLCCSVPLKRVAELMGAAWWFYSFKWVRRFSLRRRRVYLFLEQFLSFRLPFFRHRTTHTSSAHFARNCTYIGIFGILSRCAHITLINKLKCVAWTCASSNTFEKWHSILLCEAFFLPPSSSSHVWFWAEIYLACRVCEFTQPKDKRLTSTCMADSTMAKTKRENMYCVINWNILFRRFFSFCLCISFMWWIWFMCWRESILSFCRVKWSEIHDGKRRKGIHSLWHSCMLNMSPTEKTIIFAFHFNRTSETHRERVCARWK